MAAGDIVGGGGVCATLGRYRTVQVLRYGMFPPFELGIPVWLGRNGGARERTLDLASGQSAGD